MVNISMRPAASAGLNGVKQPGMRRSNQLPMPRWTHEQLHEYETRRASRRPEPQPAVPNEPMGEAPGTQAHPGRRTVRIVSFRRRLLDPDNLCPKYFIDALRYEGLIRDDTAKDIELTVSQVKVRAKSEERTEIELI